MSIQLRYAVAIVVVAALVAAPQTLTAQLDHLPYMLKYNKGQNVQPIFQGWSRNDDGSFEMHLGYLNRNYLEELHIPIGPNNNIEPGGPDQGQPTYFYTRAHRQIFSVTVPADFGDQRLVWTLTIRGKTEVAEAWLQPEWEITAEDAGVRQRGDEWLRNVPPTISVAAETPGSVGSAITLSASVSDDGLPTPRGRRQLQRNRAVGQEVPPILVPPEGTPEPPKNLPELNVNARGRQSQPTAPEGLSVSYVVWRGPGPVAFDPQFSPVEDGTGATTATFNVPGDYVLRARAFDGQKDTFEDVSVTVTGDAR